MATESELKIKLIAKEDDITKWWREHGEKEFRMKFASTGAAGFKPPPGFDPSERPSGVTAPFSSTDADLERRYKREHMKYMNQELKFMNAASSAGGAASNIAGAFFGMRSGGLGGLAKALNAEIQRMGRGGGFTNLIAGALAARGTGRALGGAAAAGAEGEGAALSGAALVGFGGFAAIAAKIGSAVVTAVTAGADVASRDIYTRSRRASGYGMGGEGGFGKITAFDDVTSRYVNPDNVLAAMRDAKYDITSSAYSALRVAGIDPKNYKDPAALGEANLLDIQKRLRGFGKADEGTILTMAHAYGLNNRGVSDEDLLRLYNPSDKNALGDLLTAEGVMKRVLIYQKIKLKLLMILLPMSDLWLMRQRLLEND
jgi:hypothetical protein